MYFYFPFRVNDLLMCSEVSMTEHHAAVMKSAPCFDEECRFIETDVLNNLHSMCLRFAMIHFALLIFAVAFFFFFFKVDF